MPRLPKLQLAGALGQDSADKRLEILGRVAAVGSISQAARDAGVSYKAAWQALDTLSNLAGAVLVERAVGGAGGGGARVTPAGQQVLRAAGELAQARQAVLGRLDARGTAAAGSAALAGMALRTSMRNQLPCTVQGWRARAGALDVRLALPGGDALVARITRESVQLLALQAGQPVLALCKATAVQVDVPGGAEPPLVNALSGTVLRAPRGKAGGELALQLAGGLRLVGFADAGTAWRAGMAAEARIEPAAVVIALAA